MVEDAHNTQWNILNLQLEIKFETLMIVITIDYGNRVIRETTMGTVNTWRRSRVLQDHWTIEVEGMRRLRTRTVSRGRTKAGTST